MNHVLTLVASDKSLTPGHLAGVERFFDQQGLCQTGDPITRAAHKAVDIPIHCALTMEHMLLLREAMATDRIDVFCVPESNRQKKLLLADMDSTIVTSETLDELAAEAGIGDKVATITARAMNGELNFEDALRERVGLLTGLPESALQRTLDATTISQGADHLVKAMHTHGAQTVLVSGGFTFFTGAIAAQLGFTHHHGNLLHIEDGALTGTVGTPILNKDSKRDFLDFYVQEMGITLKDTITIGDGANDLPMLLAAGLGIGYHPKPVVQDSVLNCILHGDLSAALYVMNMA